MMKNVALIGLLFLSLTSFSKESLRVNYEIISDMKDSNIPKGKYIIQGTIYDYYTKEVLKDVTLVSGSKRMVNGTDGSFKMKNSIRNTFLKCSKPFYRDTYVEDYKFLSQHRIKIKIFLIQEQEEQHFEVKKPVIYCYSDKDLSFNFKFKPKGNLLFAYPEAHGIEELVDKKSNTWEKNTFLWSMDLKNNRLINSADESEYPYLFWESVQYDVKYKTYKNQFESYTTSYLGEIVTRNHLLNFFDTTLTNLGFSSTEKTDFITFWLPQMKKQDFYLIQFLQNEECEQFATYQIEPKPEKVNRIYMLFAGFDQNYPNIKTVSQNLKKMERKGFYMVDWGGIEVPIKEDLNKNYIHNE